MAAAAAKTSFDLTKNADVVVIGSGPGGYPCAIRAAQLGARVVVVEADNPGGTCLNWGCIPTKTMIGTVEALNTLRHASSFGLTADNVGVDFGAVMARKDKVVKTLVGGVGYLFKKHKIRHADGIGSLVDAGTVEVRRPDGSTERITTNSVVIATGSVPARLPLPGIVESDIFTPNWDVKRKFADGTLASGAIWTSNEAVSAKAVPGELVIIGGAVVGCEFAFTYNGLGSKCTILEMQDRLIPTMDTDLSAARRKAVVFSNGKAGGEESVATADVVLVSVGRVPFTTGLNLETVGVELGAGPSKRGVKVDTHMRTNVPGVYAIGDVTGGGLAHVATMEGLVAAENICGQDQTMSYKAVPSCIYTEPEVASVGLTEQESRDKGFDVKIGTFPFKNLGKAMAINQQEGFVKIVAEGKYGEILGVHIIGPHATDLIHEGVVSIQLENTVEELMRTIHAHPTLGEAIGQANEDVMGLSIDKG
jgi:dihydrolipoamide dehydrogenase